MGFNLDNLAKYRRGELDFFLGLYSYGRMTVSKLVVYTLDQHLLHRDGAELKYSIIADSVPAGDGLGLLELKSLLTKSAPESLILQNIQLASILSNMKNFSLTQMSLINCCFRKCDEINFGYFFEKAKKSLTKIVLNGGCCYNNSNFTATHFCRALGLYKGSKKSFKLINTEFKFDDCINPFLLSIGYSVLQANCFEKIKISGLHITVNTQIIQVFGIWLTTWGQNHSVRHIVIEELRSKPAMVELFQDMRKCLAVFIPQLKKQDLCRYLSFSPFPPFGSASVYSSITCLGPSMSESIFTVKCSMNYFFTSLY